MSNSSVNIAYALKDQAQKNPNRIAMRLIGTQHWCYWNKADQILTYANLDHSSDAIAAGLQVIGVDSGVRVAVMVRPGVALFQCMFALFKLGAVPVLIDPGIDRRALKQCLAEAAPEVFLGIPLAHLARIVLGWGKPSIRQLITVGMHWLWGGWTLKQIQLLGEQKLAGQPFAVRMQDDLAAILFTSGSTGVPKGVEYHHRHFIAQLEMIREAFDIQSGEIDMPTFPPFALFDPGLGMGSVIPPMNPTKPAKANPSTLIATLEKYQCTTMFGSPALLDNLSRYANDQHIRLSYLRRILSAGAPVRPEILERAYAMLPAGAKIWTPYGATECLPVSVIEGREILATAKTQTASGAGICVGYPVSKNIVRVIKISDAPIAIWSDELMAAVGEIGEITVTGPSMTERYFQREAATQLAKIKEQFQGDEQTQTRIVHRMGDVGYFDAQGRLWYCGRKSHRVVTREAVLFSEMVEGVFNTHAAIYRSALVGVGKRGEQTPVVCVELYKHSKVTHQSLLTQLHELAHQYDVTRSINHFLVHAGFPMDIRHNAKIGREQLALWAATRL